MAYLANSAMVNPIPADASCGDGSAWDNIRVGFFDASLVRSADPARFTDPQLSECNCDTEAGDPRVIDGCIA